MASPIRLSSDLLKSAEQEGAIQKRSVPKQIELWAELGRAVSRIMDMEDVIAVIQGLKSLTLKSVGTRPVDSDTVFEQLEQYRASGAIIDKLTASEMYYESSQNTPGFLDKVDRATGKRETGRFVKGKFQTRP